MPDKLKQTRPPPISYRPPVGLRDEFDARVEKSGLSVGAFITRAVFDERPPRQARRPAVEQKLLARLLGEAARIRTALDEIALRSADPGNRHLLQQAVGDLSEIRAALLKAMGRKP